jgi:hypothetical protein
MPEQTAPPSAIVARAGTYYRVTRYIMTVVLILYGAWSIYDGFYNWQPQRWAITHPREVQKTHADIFLNEALGIVLPICGLLVLIYTLRKSRGEYRLENAVLSVPGHPPVPLDQIQSVDKQLWDRKGIAVIHYEVTGSPPATLKLDDFVYQRDPTDKIFDEIQAAMLRTPAKPPTNPPTTPVPRPTKLPPRPKLGSNL